MIKDYILITLRNFARRRLRSWLTILGILIGITAVVSFVSLGQGLQGYINEQFEKMGADKIMISPGNSLMGVVTSDIKLTKNDLNAVKNVKGVKDAGGIIFKQSNIKFKDETKTTWVMGMPQDESREIVTMQAIKIKYGRDTKATDIKKMTIGMDIYDGKFFKKEVKIGDSITLKGLEFEVIGVWDKIGNPQDDSQVYVSLSDAQDVFNDKEYGMIVAQVSKGTDIDNVKTAIEKQLRKTRDVKEKEEDFTVRTSADLMNTALSILGIVQAIIVAIAAISLVVGGIGIMNTMYTSVLERTREIGIMKAIGAKNSDILLIFLMESGMLGLVGGAIGAIIGMAFSKAAEFGAAQAGYGVLKISFSPFLIGGVLLFSFVVGAASGTLPAIQASRMKPVEALRYE